MANLSDQRNLNFAVTGQLVTNTFRIFRGDTTNFCTQTVCKHVPQWLIDTYGGYLVDDVFLVVSSRGTSCGTNRNRLKAYWVNHDFHCTPPV